MNCIFYAENGFRYTVKPNNLVEDGMSQTKCSEPESRRDDEISGRQKLLLTYGMNFWKIQLLECSPEILLHVELLNIAQYSIVLQSLAQRAICGSYFALICNSTIHGH